MVLIVEDNKILAQEIKETLELDDIDSIVVSNDIAYLKLLELGMKEISHVIMDNNIDGQTKGIDLLKLSYSSEELFFKEKTIYFFTGDVNYILKDDLKFLTEHHIKTITKSRIEVLISEILTSS